MLCSICVMGLFVCLFLGGGGGGVPRSPSLLYPDKDRWKRMDGCWFCVCVNSILTPAPVQLFAPSNGLE